MNKAFPTNSMRCISGLAAGTSRLRAKPTKNAPNMPSIPTHSIRPAPRNTRISTKIYCTTPSSTRRNVHRATRGTNNRSTTVTSNTRPNKSHTLKSPSSGLNIPPTTASTTSVSTLVRIVPPTAMPTARWRASPQRITKG